MTRALVVMNVKSQSQILHDPRIIQIMYVVKYNYSNLMLLRVPIYL
ncbi:unnamed protein product [Enterobius vermicularis]|uniref:Uncharacterized protein n=1 Tax=Enterobius vermicularis TaxID=51028 RepID=A0A0N4V431_ENTVE|nr:unnamed protein product [Enterobius vermicularis]